MTYELTVQRVLDAPPAAVFEAFTDEAAMREWYRGPDDPPDAIVEVTCDPRVGGRWVAAWGDSPEAVFRETNVFTVVDPPHRLAMSSSASTPDGQTLDTEVEITFEEYGDRTRVTIVQRGFPAEEVRDYFATHAWVGALERIAHYLDKERS